MESPGRVALDGGQHVLRDFSAPVDVGYLNLIEMLTLRSTTSFISPGEVVPIPSPGFSSDTPIAWCG
ncbi:hypothetical protein T265_00537 [Opisthorchis viverrini]|uniref:Uncharacterized protein n=1 Tax=Opisthorchis viverrini TaxID=6198 RepID=A0A075A5T3_OPIVI|nr:hypothetical protein T265_00537 [Opisthorchis viverrini]KER33647.1 hypothetical protein T265_00537 [Opisthorchis viverrini]